MTDVKHTPGPWAVELFDGKMARINSFEWTDLARVVVRMKGNDTDSPDGIANARLIAAAPDLLEALMMADAALSGAHMNMKAVKRAVLAAVAKAKGGAA